jgi:hypothetical protein
MSAKGAFVRQRFGLLDCAIRDVPPLAFPLPTGRTVKGTLGPNGHPLA